MTQRRFGLPGAALGIITALTLPIAPAQAHSRAVFKLGPGRQVVIDWRAHHIPDIRASSLEGIGFGEGYAQASDNLCTLADRFVTEAARRALYFGEDGSYTDPAIGQKNNNLDSDFVYQRIKDDRTVERLLSQPSPIGPTPAARTLARGFAAGYNRYLAKTGVEHLPDPTCRGATWVRPISELTLWRHLFATDIFASTRVLIEQQVGAAPPSLGAALPAPPNSLALPRALHPSLGSNAMAIGADGTRDHRGLLLANPDFPWHGPDRFYQAHLTIPGKLDVAGVSLLGEPLIVIGHTAGMALMLTVNFSYRFALYELSLTPGDPTSYSYSGQREAMRPQKVSVQARSADGQVVQRAHTFWLTRYGPVVNLEPPAVAWSPARAYAMTDLNATNLRQYDQFMAIDRAESVAELNRALARWQAIPWVNTIAADSQGNAYFADISVTPHITDKQIADCVTSPVGQVALKSARLPILDGSNPECALGSDPDAVQPGIYGPAEMPVLKRRDYVRNSNDPPWLANPHQPLTGYPYVVNDQSDDIGLRPRLSIKMVEARLAGTDGYGRPGFSVGLMKRMTLNDRNLSGELGRDAVVEMCREHPKLVASDAQIIDVTKACAVLAGWDTHANLDSRGEALWKAFWLGVLQLKTPIWLQPFDSQRPVDTPAQLNAQSPDVERAFADAVEYLDAHDIPLDASVAETQSVEAGGQRIPIHGCMPEEGCLNWISRGNSPTTPVIYHLDDFEHPDYGASSIQVTGWNQKTVKRCPSPSTLARRARQRTRGPGRGPTRRCRMQQRLVRPHSETILTYSQSSNPASPYSHDQTTLFSAKQWITPAWK